MKPLSAAALVIFGTVVAAGCAQDGTLTTGALNPSVTGPQAADGTDAQADPVCLTLAAQIEALKKNGVAEKVSKAAAKKYKLKAADLAKADELNKASAEYMAHCSKYPPGADMAKAEPAAPTPAPAKTAAKKKPPVPSPKQSASASAAPKTTASTAAPSATTTAPSATTTTTTAVTLPASQEAAVQSPPQP